MMYQIPDKSEPYNIPLLNVYLKFNEKAFNRSRI